MQLRAGLHRLLFVALVAAVVGVSSERMFWYWASNPLEHLAVTLVYAPAVAGCLWFIDRYRVRDFWGLVLVAPLLGYFVEGVITPVVYSGGPTPFFPVWFAFWHGVLGLGVMVFGIRRLLLERRTAALWATSAALGAFWGLWSTTMWLPESFGDQELIDDLGHSLELLTPADFATYVASFTVILAGAHWLLGRVWLTEFQPSRTMVWLWIAATGAVVIAWSVSILWAAPMFVAGVALQQWGLRRHARRGGPSVLARLHGAVPAVALVPLVAIPVTAATVYGAAWELDPAEDIIRAVAFYGVIVTQTLVGAVLIVRSFLSVRHMAPEPQLRHDQAHVISTDPVEPDARSDAATGVGAAGPGSVA